MSHLANAFDFRNLLDAGFAQRVMAPSCVLSEGLYRCGDGVQFHTPGRKRQLVQEVVQITDGALLLACDSLETTASSHEQLIRDSDWIHIQFHLRGGGQERVSRTNVIDTPEESCIVVRYPRDSLVERATHAAQAYRVACLLLNPKALTNLLDAPAQNLPKQVAWMAQEEPLTLKASVLSLTPTMRATVSDILSCGYRGSARRAYMRAKSLELISSVVHALDEHVPEPSRCVVPLTSLDLKRIETARRIMVAELGSSMTLAELARRVGLNRTKLALGFKEVYGASVQAYWRDEKLSRARELLQCGPARVTDIALGLGYSELSSFTRAFMRKFGEPPRSIKSLTK